MTKADIIPVDVEKLRADVRDKYRAVASEPHRDYHFHTGRALAEKLGYDNDITSSLPDAAVESFAGVANPFSMHSLEPGQHVVDVGSGAGFDSFVAARLVQPNGAVIGVDMTPEMLRKARATAELLGEGSVEFLEGFAEALPVADEWADVVISNGVINLCADKRAVFAEIRRVLRPGGVLQFADIANGASGPSRSLARCRSLDWLNRRRAAPCGLAANARRRRIRRRRHRTRDRYVRRCPRRRECACLRRERVRVLRSQALTDLLGERWHPRQPASTA